ncbi:GNAT family N-acetyltransferase [Pseudomonas palleroniana]
MTYPAPTPCAWRRSCSQLRPRCRRRGVGRRLVNAALEQARANVVTVRAS